MFHKHHSRNYRFHLDKRKRNQIPVSNIFNWHTIRTFESVSPAKKHIPHWKDSQRFRPQSPLIKSDDKARRGRGERVLKSPLPCFRWPLWPWSTLGRHASPLCSGDKPNLGGTFGLRKIHQLNSLAYFGPIWRWDLAGWCQWCWVFIGGNVELLVTVIDS